MNLARPHPGPVPHPPSLGFGAMQERENRSPASRFAERFLRPSAPGVESPIVGNREMIIRTTCSARLLFPLLGGEGQGEGGLHTKLSRLLGLRRTAFH